MKQKKSYRPERDLNRLSIIQMRPSIVVPEDTIAFVGDKEGHDGFSVELD